ncbi:hypothetical protein VP01_2934g2 [Puccinia sorghi]|uniref:Uncharacterized protein n=1 Tax=Puccinia sorghi TaxID=27349 RepID=A0A0L6V2V7_9BASI|nr:hypothetical protein VP01_2934g2 [Puccinia sorghi]
MAPSQVLTPHNLYSTIPWVDNKPTCCPTPKEAEEAYNQIQSYRFLHSGLDFVQDPLNEESIIAIIQFTPLDKLTPSEKDVLNFSSTFLKDSKWLVQILKKEPNFWMVHQAVWA